MNPGDLRRAARRCLEAIATDKAVVDAHENTLLVDEEAAALARSELTMWDNPDGTLSGRFTVPHFAGAVLRKTIESMTSPRRAALGATKAQSGPVGFDRDAMAHRAGLAFVELLEHLPTDRLHSKVAGTVVVTIEQAHLDQALVAAGSTPVNASAPVKHGGSPATQGSCPPYSAESRCHSTSAAPSDCSPRARGSRLA